MDICAYASINVCMFSFYADPANVTVSPSGFITINETDNVTLTCKGFGIPLPALAWFSNETLLDSFELLNISEGVSTSTGVDDTGQMISISTLELLSIMKDEENISYTCSGENEVRNDIGAISRASVSIIIQGMGTLWFA